MTYIELINNISKSNCKSSNYARLVGKRAYEHCIDYNDYVKDLQALKRAYKEAGVITDHKYYKGKIFTIYTKIPKFRTYKQQYAITYKTLETELYERMISRSRRKSLL